MNPTYDMPKNYYFGGGSQESFLTPWAAAVLCLAIVLIFLAPRRSVIIPLVTASVLLPFDIIIVVLGFHLFALRILLLAGCLRLALRGDFHTPRMNSIDKTVLLWALCNAIVFSILWGTMGAVNNRLGFLWTNLGAYFLVRFLIRDKSDVVCVIRVLAILMAIIAPLMLIERFTRHNVFSIVGAPLLSAIRDGNTRAEGPFGHPIIAGTIAGMLLPLFIGLWWQGRRHRKILAMGAVASICVMIASSSSTPFVTGAAGVFALALWSYRNQLRAFRRAFVLAIVGLQLAMKAPVWFLIARTGGAIGGSGYHRAMLIDNFVRHFDQWWLIGTRNNPSWGFDMWDVDNAFVAAAFGGGLITLLALIAVLVCAFKRIGESRRLAGLSVNDERLVWAIGASLFANTVGFFGIVYFDQSILLWYCLLAMISATAMFDVSGKELAARHTRPRAAMIEKLVPAAAWYEIQR